MTKLVIKHHFVGRIPISWWKIVSQASFGKSKNPISTFPLAVGQPLLGWWRRWCSKIPLVWYMCVSWKLEITPKTETYHFLFITARVDDPDRSSFKPFFCTPKKNGLQQLSCSLVGLSPPRKKTTCCGFCRVRIASVRMTRYKSGISPTASSRIWRPTWLLFSKKT